MRDSFAPGITTLLSAHRDWLRGRRVGLVSHPAAVDAQGRGTAHLLRAAGDFTLTALFGPEHGFFGAAGAGQPCARRRHPLWGLPVFSLYGPTRKPTAAMLRGVDTLVVDFQDIGARPYTYVSTLKLVLEAAAEQGRGVIVADRPVPLPCVADGPATEPGFASFVAAAPLPLSYGMTPGESALWLKDILGLRLDLRVAPMRGYWRQPRREPSWPPWIPPSPAMLSWESAACYPATVLLEAFAGLDHGRRTPLPFQLVGCPRVRGPALSEALSALRLPGARFDPHVYAPDPRENPRRVCCGARLVITDPHRFRPARVALEILAAAQALLGGSDRLWRGRSARPEFFDKLCGTDRVRLALADGETPRRIAAAWAADLAAFGRTRRRRLLYPRALQKEEVP